MFEQVKQIVEIISVIDLVGSMNHFNNGTLIKPQQVFKYIL
jgi:hypothetical protein